MPQTPQLSNRMPLTPLRVLSLMGGLAAICLASPSVLAQPPVRTPPAPKVEIPKGLRPPPGMCRVWLEKVPAGQQPAPTDCARAIRNRPPNARVIFSEESARRAAPPKGSSKTEAKKPPKKPDGDRR